MNSIIFVIDTTTIIVAISVAILILIGIIIWISVRSKKQKVPALDQTFKNQLVEALGGFDNIVNTNLEQQRLQIKVNNTKLIHAEFFKNEKIPAFISGTKITVLFKEHAKEIFQFLASKGA